MKRMLTLTLALLLAVSLVGFGGAKIARAEENPYVGLWEITGAQDGETTVTYAEMNMKVYLDFLPNGAIYAVRITEEGASLDYFAYKMTGENTLDVFEGEDALPSVYDPATGVITVTDPDSSFMTFVERVKEDPLPDVHALVDLSEEEQTYYGYAMTQSGQAIDMLETLPIVGMDPRDFYVTLDPDGTGYMQLGSEEAAGDITWTETEFIAEGNAIAYTREGDHILFYIDDSNGIEFAPEGEVEALMAMKDIEIAEPSEGVDIDSEAVVGEWTLAKATALGQELTIEQIQAQGLDLAFRFNADGSAVMINKGEETDGISWRVEDGDIVLYVGTYDMFTFDYDGEYLILSVGAQIYFEKVA